MSIAGENKAMVDESVISVKVSDKSFTRYDGETVRVLRDIEFTAGPNQVIVLTGPSGCGKSTLLNIIAGLDEDYHGTVMVPSTPHSSDDNRLALSYMFQEPCLLPWRTVKDNVSLALQNSQGCEDAVLSVLNDMGLAEAANNYPATLSLGMLRRVALARSFIVDAPLLLMDEPFASLDEMTAIHLRKLLLNQLQLSARTVIFVTHNLREALFFGNRLLIFSKQPATLTADIPLLSEVGIEGRDSREIEKLNDEIKQQYPQIFG